MHFMAMNLPFLMHCAFSTSEKVPSPFFPIRRYSAQRGQGVSPCGAALVGVPRPVRPVTQASARQQKAAIEYCASARRNVSHMKKKPFYFKLCAPNIGPPSYCYCTRHTCLAPARNTRTPSFRSTTSILKAHYTSSTPTASPAASRPQARPSTTPPPPATASIDTRH
jgi:hypothetical protein